MEAMDQFIFGARNFKSVHSFFFLLIICNSIDHFEDPFVLLHDCSYPLDLEQVASEGQ